MLKHVIRIQSGDKTTSEHNKHNVRPLGIAHGILDFGDHCLELSALSTLCSQGFKEMKCEGFKADRA